jgi:hypothetical protein
MDPLPKRRMKIAAVLTDEERLNQAEMRRQEVTGSAKNDLALLPELTLQRTTKIL